MLESPVYWTREAARYQKQSTLDLFLEQGSIKQVATLDAFEIPANPTWTEDPYNSRTWSLYYYSMGWLLAAEEGYKQGRFPDFLDYMKTMILDFMAANTDTANPSHAMVYNDAANAFRIGTISYLYDTYIKTGLVTFTAAEETIFAQGLENHRDQLLFQLDQTERWAFSNHRFFHAMGLTTYASIFGQDASSPFYDANANDLFEYGLWAAEDIVNQVVDLSTGITREQSFLYHRLDLSLILELQKYVVQDAGYELGTDYTQVIQQMLEFDLLTRRPDGSIAEIGDTPYGSTSGSSSIFDVINAGNISPTAEYLVSEGASGVRPADLIDLSDGGYIIYRPEYLWEDARDTRIVFDVSDTRLSHGNFDNLNFIYASYGENILIDSGGPYSYDSGNYPGLNGAFRYEYFFTSQAHNVVVVDGESYDAPVETIRVVDTADYSFSYAAHQGYDNITISRGLLYLKQGVMLVLDFVENNLTTNHAYALNYHFNPLAEGVDAAAQGEAKIGDVYVDTAFATSGAASYQVIEGRLGDNPQGWVTPALYEAIPNPTLEIAFTGQDAWFTSAFATSLEQTPALSMHTIRVGNSLQVTLQFGGLVWEISLNVDGTLLVNQVAGGISRVPSVGDDVITGTSGSDSIDALAGNDRVDTGDGDDYIKGGAGDDAIQSGNGNDSVRGGSGNDQLYGDNGHDYLVGETGHDILNGGAGNDTLVAGDGNDTLDGGSGADNMFGGLGNDSMFGSSNDDVIKGNEGDDTLDGGEGADFLYGGDGNDSMLGYSGNDTLRAGAGNDRLIAGIGNDIAYGEAGNDYINGFTGVDYLDGGAGDDSIIGGDSNDTIYGGAGEDILRGDAGADLLFGGAGVDRFLFRTNKDSTYSNRDLVMDFEQGIDKLDFSYFIDTNDAATTADDTQVVFTGVMQGVGSGTLLGFSYDAASDRTSVRSAPGDVHFYMELQGQFNLTINDFNF